MSNTILQGILAWNINTQKQFTYIDVTPLLDVSIEAMALELEMADPNSMCLDGHGIGVWKFGSFPRGIRFTWCDPEAIPSRDPPYWRESHPLLLSSSPDSKLHSARRLELRRRPLRPLAASPSVPSPELLHPLARPDEEW